MGSLPGRPPGSAGRTADLPEHSRRGTVGERIGRERVRATGLPRREVRGGPWHQARTPLRRQAGWGRRRIEPAKASPNRPPSYGNRPGPGTARPPGARGEGRPSRGPGYQRPRPNGDPKAEEPRPERRPGTAGGGRPKLSNLRARVLRIFAVGRDQGGPGKPAKGSRERQTYRKRPGV